MENLQVLDLQYKDWATDHTVSLLKYLNTEKVLNSIRELRLYGTLNFKYDDNIKTMAYIIANAKNIKLVDIRGNTETYRRVKAMISGGKPR